LNDEPDPGGPDEEIIYVAVSAAADLTSTMGPSGETTGVERPRRPAPPEAAALQSRLPRLADGSEIARGGMASVHRVFDRNIRRFVALKRVDPELIQTTPDAVQLFVEEAQITGQLEHPNIVPIYDLGTDDANVPLFTMKLIRGQTLSELVAESDRNGHTPAQLRRILEVFLKICDAIAFAHSRGVIHRDLKPDNVMVGAHGQVYVMDWGCALLRGDRKPVAPGGVAAVAVDTTSRRSMPRIVLGTAAYMAPEQAHGRVDEVDERSDIYGLGAILYYVLTRRPPHGARNYVESVLRAQAGEVAPPEQVRPHASIPRALAGIAMRALAPEAKDRFASVAELRLAVERFLTGAGWFPHRQYKAGEVILREGEIGEEAFLIVSGACEAWRTVGGTRVPLRRMGAGEMFGETAIITAQPRSASVVAISDVEVTVISRATLEQELGDDSWIGALVRTLATRFRDAERRGERAARAAVFTRIIEAARVHLLAAGTTADGWISAPWSRLLAAIAVTMDVDEELVRQAILGSAELRLDEAADLIRSRA
jgi:serine/threonine-protein kinase